MKNKKIHLKLGRLVFYKNLSYGCIDMLNSMTGFAHKMREAPFGLITWELRATNHRFLDIQLRLPEELRSKEIELRTEISKTIKRGKVDCVMVLRHKYNDNEIQLNKNLLTKIATLLREIATIVPKTKSVDPISILRWPGVMTESEIDTEPLYITALQLLQETLSDLTQMRLSEGGRIQDMLTSRLTKIEEIVANVRRHMPEILETTRIKQLERINKLAIDAEPARLETELALIAQKLDVDEERDRLASHIQEVRITLKNGTPMGRRLDFLMQELNREANTLGSKSVNGETTKAAVDLKVLIEQMREQVQNVE